MKNLVTIFCLFVGVSLFAQVANITYVTVPRDEADQFLILHEKFSNLSISDERTLQGGGLFAHAFAGDYSFAIYDFYASAEDLVKDSGFAEKALEANVEAMNLDEEGQKAMMSDYRTYTRMYADNHSDQVRVSKGLEDLMYESEALDWSTKKVVVVSKYEVKWGKNKDFFEGIVNGSLKNIKESGHAVAHYASRHLYGSGADWHTYQFFDTWTDFAAFEEANVGVEMDDTGKKFWSAIEGHDDEILVLIGGHDPETKKFALAN
jgi:hypothetical protein